MNQYAEHDRVGVCHRLRTDGLYVKSFPGGYPYVKGSILTRSSVAEPIVSYGKNYEGHGHKFGLFVWTTNSNHEAVEKLLDESADKVTKDMAERANSVGSFFYLDD